jgi:predicted nucleotide-binding protein
LPAFHLVRPKADVLKDLRKQISKGREIAEYEYDEDEVEDAINDESKWDLLNVEILRREFSDDTPLNEYKSIQLTKYYGDWEDRLVTHEIRVGKRITFLESVVERINKKLIPESGERVTQSPSGGERVFIIHGHDEASKSQVARLVEKLGFTAVILAEQTNRGRTIIEKLERHSDVAFAVAILTPDDVVGTQSARARQNVILELGHFEGKLGRDRVCILYVPGVDMPSDIKGVAYYELDKAGAWRYSLARELKDAGFPVDMNKL